ncbi:ankyrin repeat domain-containing protein [Wenyingzhuangia sp. IMCC45574]
MSLFKKMFSSTSSEFKINRTKQLYEIDDKIRREFYEHLYKCSSEKVIEIIEKEKIDVNSFTNSDKSCNLLIQVISDCASEQKGTENHVRLISYLIDNGAEIDTKSADGYNALEIALSYHNLSNISLILIKTGKVEINSTEKNGNNPIFTAIREYGLTWREEQKEVNQLRFEIIEELLNRGADLDKINNHGITARKWLERISEDDRLHSLIEEFDKK